VICITLAWSHEPVSSPDTLTSRLSALRPGSIRNKILVFAVLATLLPSLTTAWISYVTNKRSLTAKATEELSSISSQTARELDLWTKERRYDLRVFASSYEVTENLERLSSPRARERLTDYLNSVRERFADYAELIIMDADGRVVASSGGQPAAIDLPADWKARLRSDHLVLGTPYWNDALDRPEMLVIVPVGMAEKRLLGAITARVSLTMLSSTLARFAPAGPGQVYLATGGGELLLSSRESSPRLMGLKYPAEAIRSHLSRQGRPAEFTNVSGEQVLGSVLRVPGLDWIVIAEIPSSEVFRQLSRLRNVTLLIVLAMLAVAGGLGYSLGLFIVRPLDRLTKGAAKVAAGDLEVDLPVAMGGEAGYLTEVFNNMVSRLKASRHELERLSLTDPLTGLYNRRRMMEALDNEVRRSRRLAHTFSVLMADVDHFKRYNDAHGHVEGDKVLKRVAALLLEATRDVDVVARYGGEEFFVLMPETDAQRAAEVAERIREKLSGEPTRGGGVTVSFGIAEFRPQGDTGESLISRADAALYQAKHEGRDRVMVARTAARTKAVAR
jgi:diguanylate cyclase (GGDEF)-like protein